MIYFDNAATSYPKPLCVSWRGATAAHFHSFNSGRGGYRASLRAAERIFKVRAMTAAFFGFDSEQVVFTKNCTEALNIAIKGLAKSGGHFVISSLEHNSVSRVVQHLQDSGCCDYDIAAYDVDERRCVSRFERLIKPNTCAVICTHASNVFGVVFPIAKIGEMCRRKGVPFIVDAAQSAGLLPLNAKRDYIDILCAPGHKGLLGPMGTGILAVGDGIHLHPLMEGGTGTASLSLRQPEGIPERLESGTLNNPGIMALGEGLRYLQQKDVATLYHHEMQLCQAVYRALNEIEGVTLFTAMPENNRFVPLLSFVIKGHSGEAVASYLARHHICVRGGYHCSYLAHQHFGTLETGTVRLSFGCFNTYAECERFVKVLKKFAF